MNTSLCLLVKDEERTIEDCLGPVHDLFDDIQVTDTGSTDRTVELLRDRFRISPGRCELSDRHCYAKYEARNQLIARARHPWILFLDADERITREQAQAILRMKPEPGVSGWFCAWNTFLGAGMVEDYKLSLFRREVRYSGLIHENTQQHVRRTGSHADWLDDVVILHHPDAAKHEEKRRLYRWRLQCALSHEDDWYRYHWFMGYMLYRNGELDDAVHHLTKAAHARPREFPVESLNSHMVLAVLHARRGDAAACGAILDSALAFHREVADDFEVRINFRLQPCLDASLAACRAGRLDHVTMYDFAY